MKFSTKNLMKMNQIWSCSIGLFEDKIHVEGCQEILVHGEQEWDTNIDGI